MTYKIFLLATASMALGLGACNRADDRTADEVAATNDIVANEIANDMAATAEAPMATSDFISAAAASDMYEIEAGKLAAEKGSTQAVKAFGAMLEKDHKGSTEQLKTAVAEIPTTMPVAETTAEQKAMIDALKAASGVAFDKAFVDQQVDAHTKALAMLNAYAAGGEAAPLKQFATKVSPVVQAHLDKAKSMQQ